MQTTSQLTWQVDQAEVQRLVDALRNYIKKPKSRSYTTWLHVAHYLARVAMVAIVGLIALASYELAFKISSSFLFAVGASIGSVILAVGFMFLAGLPPDIGEGMSVISLRYTTLKLPDLLAPLYAVMTLYGQDPEKIKIEEFERGAYCGKFFRCRTVLPLGNSTLEVWIGHIYNDLIIIRGLRPDRTNVINAIRYYFYTKYNYVITNDSCAYLWPDEKRAINLEMWLCKNRDKISEWIAQGKKIEEPQLESYYDF
jgi:hypothetical protein